MRKIVPSMRARLTGSAETSRTKKSGVSSAEAPGRLIKVSLVERDTRSHKRSRFRTEGAGSGLSPRQPSSAEYEKARRKCEHREEHDPPPRQRRD